MNRVGIYTRPGPDGRDPRREIERLQQVAEANAWIVGGVFIDRNGTFLREVLEAARSGEFQIVMVWSLDRLTRSPHTFSRLYRWLKKSNIRLVAVEPPFGFTRPKRSLSDEPAVRTLIDDFEREHEWVFRKGLAP